MKNKTLVWRITILSLLVIAVPGALVWYDQHRTVSTEPMLDVSVSVKTISHVRTDVLGDTVWSPTSGSGFMVSSSRCEVLTNHHVIAEAAQIKIFPRQQSDAAGIPATVLNSNPRTDIAILKMDHCDGIPEALLGDSSLLRPGDEVYAVGNPLGLNPDSISRGIVSHTERFTSDHIPFLQTDATISLGSSGGALFNREGQVIGVNTAIVASGKGGSIGLAYALPVNLVKREIQILRAGPPSWGDAGLGNLLTLLTQEEARFFNVPEGKSALVVTETPHKGPSKGKLFAKDAIFEIDNTQVVNVNTAHRTITNHAPGESITFKLVRDATIHEVIVTLEEGWQSVAAPAPDHYSGYLGLTLEMWREDDAFRGQYDSPVITKVHSLGPGHFAQIESSQKTFARRGSIAMPIQIDVKAIAGIVFDGTYHSVRSISEIESIASAAFEADLPLLLEIETWGRRSALSFDEPLERIKTTYHSLQPRLTAAKTPPPEDTDDVSLTMDNWKSGDLALAHPGRGR